MAKIGVTFSVAADEFEDMFRAKYQPVAKAATEAVAAAGDQVKREGRANIASAGFSTRWQNALRVDVFPKRPRVSANAAAFIFHKIGYAGVFEEGATIRGKPLLWLALKTAPQRIGRSKITPKLYSQRFGKLVPMKSRSGKPLLGARVRLTDSQAKQRRPRISATRLSQGTGGTGTLRTVPLFVGVRQVTLKPRFSIRAITQDARDRLPQLFIERLRDN